MNFAIIFLCLLTGTVIGYEFGKYMMSKRINDIFKEFAANIKKEAEEQEKKREEARQKLQKITADILQDLKNSRIEKQKAANGDTDGDKNHSVLEEWGKICSKQNLIDQRKE